MEDVADKAHMRRAWTILAVVGLSNLQMAMALSMIFVIFPDLEDSFPDASSATLSWAVNIFTIVGASTLVLGSAVAQRFGAKPTLMAGTAIFTIASVLAALSPVVGLLIACRVLQALGASLAMPAGAALAFTGFPLARRGTAIATWSAIGAVGAALGPSLGGLLIDVGSWRWAFWLNLPMGAFSLAMSFAILPRTTAMAGVKMPDAVSSVALFFGLGLVVLGLVESPDWGWFDARTIGTMLIGAVLLLVVYRRSQSHPRPLLRLDLFRYRTFGQGNLAMLIFSTSFFGFLLTAVVFQTDVWGYSIRKAGLYTTPIFAVTAIMSVVSGRVGDRIGYKWVTGAGGAFWAAGTLWMGLGLAGTPSPSMWLGAVVVVGIGSGLLWGSMLAVTLSALPGRDLSAGAGLNQTLQNLGNTLGVAVAVTVLGEVTLGEVGAFSALWITSAVITVIAAVVGVRSLTGVGLPSRGVLPPIGEAAASAPPA